MNQEVMEFNFVVHRLGDTWHLADSCEINKHILSLVGDILGEIYESLGIGQNRMKYGNVYLNCLLSAEGSIVELNYTISEPVESLH